MSHTPPPWPGAAPTYPPHQPPGPRPSWPTTPPPALPPQRTGHTAHRGLAIALLLPALLAWILAYVVPTGFLIHNNLRWDDLLALDDYPASDNGNGLWDSVKISILLAVVPLIASIAIALPLARAARGAGRTARLITRGLLAIPLACYTPAAMAATWWNTRMDENTTTTATLSVNIWIGLGLVIAVATTIHLATNHEHQPPRVTRTITATIAIAILATTLQTIQTPFVLSWRSRDGAEVPLYESSDSLLMTGDLPSAPTPLFVLVAVLGILATVLLLRAQIRVEYPPEPAIEPTVPQHARRTHTAGLLVLGGAFLLCLGYALAPWLSHLSLIPETPVQSQDSTPVENESWAGALLLTWGPSLVGAVVGVSLAAAAGFAIGALRPLGSRSEYLLLPLAPWLLMGGDLLILGGYYYQYWFTVEAFRIYDNRVVNFVNLIPPTWFCIPALFFFTFFFRGTHHLATTRGETLLSPWRAFAQATPLIGAGILIACVVNAHDRLSPWLSIASGEFPYLGIYDLWMAARADTDDHLRYVMTIDYPVLLLLLAIGLLAFLQIRYVDRLRIRGGRATPETPWQLPDPATTTPSQAPAPGPALAPHNPYTLN